jgi:WD40 repeat protein
MLKRYRVIQLLFCLFVCGTLLFAVLSVNGCADQTKVGFQLDDTEVPSAVFSPDSKYIIAGGSRRISLLDLAGQKLIDRFPEANRGNYGTNTYEVIAVSPDGKYVASAAGVRVEEMPVKIWNLQTGKLVHTFNTNHTQIRSLTFSHDGNQLAAATSFRLHDVPKPYEPIGEIWLWDIRNENKEPIRFKGHAWAVEDIAFLPDGKRIISIGIDLTLRLWDIHTQNEIKRSSDVQLSLKAPPAGSRFDSITTNKTLSLKISADGKRVACGRSVWDVENMKVEYLADGDRLWKDYDEWFRFNNPLEESFTNEEKPRKIISTFACHYHGVLTPDGSRLVVDGVYSGANSEDNIFVYDMKKGTLLYKDRVFSNGASVFALDVSPDGRYAFAGGSGVTSGIGGQPVMSDPNQLYLYRLPSPSASTAQTQVNQQEGDTPQKK